MRTFALSLAAISLALATLPSSLARAEDPATKPKESEKPKVAGSEKPKTPEKPKVVGPVKPRPANRLAKETSPYLLQHAHNPVDWYPWGEEAMAKAKKEGKLIFLSVGYSSCHWCHVMERESFLDDEIAEYLNKHFVCIKVDREERPDIDSIYMTALQVYNQLAGTGRGGGWPMSMFLTPEAEPVFGGTYFPARDGDRGPSTGFLTLVKRVQEVWAKSPDKIREDGKTIVKYTKTELETRRPAVLTPIDDKLYAAVQKELEGQFDEKWGGFGFSEINDNRPKFPEPSNLAYLIDRVQRSKDEEAKRMLVATLEKMEMGGIRDHLGGGFHRYSTDRFWRIPHFEKMLYDNGQLAGIYAEAYRLTGREDFRRVCEELCDFVLREMTDENGGFYAALDADAEDEEGKFYRWEKAEVQKLLTKEEFQLFSVVYGLTGEPNFEEKYYAPQLAQPMAENAKSLKMKESELEAQLTPIRKKLLDARGKRARPLTDTKMLTADNGLMIGGLADAARILKASGGRQPPDTSAKADRYLAAAIKAADFVLANLRTKEGRLLRTYSKAGEAGGKAKLNAYVDDYAFLVDGLLRLHQATGDKKWLTAAGEITTKQVELFQDEKSGGFYFTSSDHEALFARGKNPVDGAIPSGNSVAACNLLLLAKALKKPDLVSTAQKTIASSAGLLEQSPSSAPRMAVAIPLLLEQAKPEEKKEGKKPEEGKTPEKKTEEKKK
ncbi:MAG: thioredoxin domain-containing protein [Pirellulaceae bacterium]